jgi:hypothetical protein
VCVLPLWPWHTAVAAAGGDAEEEDLSDEEAQAIFTPKLSWGAAFAKVRKALVLRTVATELVDAAKDRARTVFRGGSNGPNPARDRLLEGMDRVRIARAGDSFGELELMSYKPSACLRIRTHGLQTQCVPADSHG